jgi:hypothetical protein
MLRINCRQVTFRDLYTNSSSLAEGKVFLLVDEMQPECASLTAQIQYQKWSSLEVQRKECTNEQEVSKISVNGVDSAAGILNLQLDNH